MAWRDLYIYWRDSHRQGRPPSRADIDPPLQIPRLLPNLFLMELVGSHFRVRLVGSDIARRAGRDSTGQILDPTVMPERAIPAFAILLQRAAETCAPRLYSAGPGTQTNLRAIGILLPLVDRTNAVEMILGGLFYKATRTHGKGEQWDPGALSELSLAEMLADQGNAKFL
ncbi:MAG: hypothetical protein JWM91_5060 [Rhodospirillales bacterium]|nr:hypothetical protein [Rhodospirillales bacterium]